MTARARLGNSDVLCLVARERIIAISGITAWFRFPLNVRSYTSHSFMMFAAVIHHYFHFRHFLSLFVGSIKMDAKGMEGARPYIPNRLRKHRRLQGYRQRDVAKLLGHSNTGRISMWEKGLAFPSVLNLFKLSLIYRTLPNELYFDLIPELKEFVTKQEQLVLKR